MKFLIASDIHGSAYYCEQLLQAFEREQAARLLLLGDILYHGPRNDLPRDYAPKKVIAERHGRYNPLRARQLRHRGGPDGAHVPNPRGLCRPAGRGAAGVCHARTSIQHENTASVVSGRCAAARTYAYSGMGAVWQGKPVSESGFSVHPEKRYRTWLYDTRKRRFYMENAERRTIS